MSVFSSDLATIRAGFAEIRARMAAREAADAAAAALAGGARVALAGQ